MTRFILPVMLIVASTASAGEVEDLRTEVAALRAELKAAQERIVELETASGTEEGEAAEPVESQPAESPTDQQLAKLQRSRAELERKRTASINARREGVAKDFEKKIKAVDVEIAKLYAKKRQENPTLKLVKGSVGELGYEYEDHSRVGRGTVESRTLSRASGPSTINEGNLVRVRQVVDESNVIVEAYRTSIWVSGRSTDGLVDDDNARVQLPGVYRYLGTKQYDSADGGTTTIHHIEYVEPVERPTP